MFERRWHALSAGAVLLVVASVLTIAVGADPTDPVVQPADDAWLSWMLDLRTAWMTRLATAVSWLGGPWVMVPVRLLVVLALALRRRWIQLGAFVGAVVTSELCIGPFKALIDRPRPDAALVSVQSAAFPSGHAIAASVTAIGLVIVLVPPRRRRTRWTLVAACFALLMAMSRTYLGVHWASDVVAGACIGTGLAVAWPAALELARSQWRADGSSIPARPWPIVSRVVAVVLLSVGLVCVVALHWLRADLDPTAHRISEYAIGPHGSLMAVAFVSIGAGLLALVWPFAVAGGRWSRPVAAAVALAGVGMVVSGVFPTDPIRSGTMADRVHSQASALATVALITAAIAWSVVRRPRSGTRVAAALAVTAAVLGAASPLLHRSAWTGTSQRALWLALVAWLLVTACTTSGGRQRLRAR